VCVCQKIQLRIEGRENGDLRAVATLSGVPLNLQMSETHILIRLLRVYISRNWEFGLALVKLRNFGGEPPTPPAPTQRLSIALHRSCHRHNLRPSRKHCLTDTSVLNRNTCNLEMYCGQSMYEQQFNALV
jgi:hypothetical protein